MDAGSVTVAYVHDVEVAHSFHLSFLNLVMADCLGEGRIMRGGYIAVRYGTGGIIEARNKVAAEFLSRDAEWLLVIDTDMGFAPDSLERLLAVADPQTHPVVGGLCFAQKETVPDGIHGYRCAPRVTILDWVNTPDGRSGFSGRAAYPINALVSCAATGSAFILIHRSVLEAIAEEHGPVWYDRIPSADGGLLGEDVSFCVRAQAAGHRVAVHTGVRTSHMKTLWLAEEDFWTALDVTPATEQVAVLVPVTQRPQNAEPFMRSLRASTGLAEAVAICDADDHDTQIAWKEAGATVLLRRGSGVGTFAQKVNHGYRDTEQPWVFIVGDDVRFHPGWLDHAQHIAHTTGASVIGTNDLGNPRVTSGEHATHLLLRRSHIDEHGTSWDGPGVLAHEGYRHWYVDDEIVTRAKQAGVWQMALGSIVEHLHPAWGKADDDDVYALGQAHSKADYATFRQRCATYLQS